MTGKLKKIGPLKAVVNDAPLGESKIVLFHGYGANAFDLAPLADVIDPGRPLSWYFPEGHLQVPIGPGFYGRGWFPINLAAAERTINGGDGIDYSKVRPPGLDEAVGLALEFLKEINFQPGRDCLGGFSQGSMLALEVSKILRPRALIIYSGSLVDVSDLRSKTSAFVDLPVFQSHGIADPILPFQQSLALKNELENLDAKVKWVEFSGGHEIPMEILKDTSQFLKK